MKRYLLLLALLALSACATATADSFQTISVVTQPEGAHCRLSNSQGSWEIAHAPGSADVKRSFSPLKITCAKPGAGTAQTTLEPATRNRAYGNILLLGYPAFVDAATGDGYEYGHTEVTLALTRE